MPSIGEQLRLAREKQGRSIAELATATCISSRYLASMEGDDRAGLPGDFFYRNFLKQYAKALSLDSRPLIEQLDATLPRDERDPLPVLSECYVPPGKPASSPSRARAIFSLILLIAAITGGAGFYAWWEKSQRKDPIASIVEKKVAI